MIEYLSTLKDPDKYELAERLNFELYPNKGNRGHEFYNYEGNLHLTTWDCSTDCVMNNIHNSLIVNDYGILAGDPNKIKINSLFMFMLEKFGDSWYTSALDLFQGDNNTKNVILLNQVKREYDEIQASKQAEDGTSDLAPCDCNDIGL